MKKSIAWPSVCWLKRATPDGAAAEHGVGGGGAVGGDDLDRLLAVDVAVDFPEDVEEVTIHRGLVLAAPVAEEVIELLQRLFVVAAVALEGDGEVFVGMGVVEGKRAGLVQRGRIMHRPGAGKEQQATSGRSDIRPSADDSELNWRAKPASTYEPTQSTSDQRISFAKPQAKEGERILKAGGLTEVYRTRPQVRLNLTRRLWRKSARCRNRDG